MIELILRAYIYIQQHFMFSPIIIIAMIIMTIILILGICVICIITLIDSFYRPNMPQYPFNLFLDKIMPLIVIIMPTILILLLNENTSYRNKFAYIICTHMFVIVPIIFYWSTNRNWFLDKKDVFLWSHPGFYLNFSIAIIYPTIWCLFLSFIRYLRLGSTINILYILI